MIELPASDRVAPTARPTLYLGAPHPQGAPHDPDIPLRAQRLSDLGLRLEPVAEFDQFATRVAEAAEAPYAMVNFITDDQFFAGLHAPSPDAAEALNAARVAAQPAITRIMTRDRGYCPFVASLKLARVLDDVCIMPKWRGNRVVSEMNVRAYIGAPIIDPDTDIALGTVCAVANKTASWGRPGLTMIKNFASELTTMIMDSRPR